MIQNLVKIQLLNTEEMQKNLLKQAVHNVVFKFILDLLNGSKSPVIPSPPSGSTAFEHSTFLTPFASSDKQHHLEFGTVGQKYVTNNTSLVNALINNAAALDRNRSSRK